MKVGKNPWNAQTHGMLPDCISEHVIFNFFLEGMYSLRLGPLADLCFALQGMLCILTVDKRTQYLMATQFYIQYGKSSLLLIGNSVQAIIYSYIVATLYSMYGVCTWDGVLC